MDPANRPADAARRNRFCPAFQESLRSEGLTVLYLFAKMGAHIFTASPNTPFDWSDEKGDRHRN